ncbi:MAG: hypothetical protein QGF90_05275 [Gammaproteobacteria bacterium]|jgi:hypothetical protein|nr:hypothetical protein [Gammaproteobacteria bacterium]|tara:strand:- start:392 stop:559 length:168 start_codon:yes stop_codon:yes gene_type:complete
MGYTAGPAAEAEVIYHKDLQWNQQNPWSTFGLCQTLQAQGKEQETIIIRRQFDSW